MGGREGEGWKEGRERREKEGEERRDATLLFSSLVIQLHVVGALS